MAPKEGPQGASEVQSALIPPERTWAPIEDGTEFKLGSLGHSEYRVLKPIRVIVHGVHGKAIATWPDANITANGANLGEALANLQTAIIEEAAMPTRETLRQYVAKRK
jgi:hypothetical protein